VKPADAALMKERDALRGKQAGVIVSGRTSTGRGWRPC
jgi:hypothetical protein